MNCNAEILSDSLERNSESNLCRLCRKNHDYYYNIFSSKLACKITVKDALHDLVGLQVTVRDGLPATMCPLCLKKLTEFSVFKRICLESNVLLRKKLVKNCCRSIKGGGAAYDTAEPSLETEDGIGESIKGGGAADDPAEPSLDKEDGIGESIEGGGAADEKSVETKDCIPDVIENTSEFACSDQMTEVYIPVSDCLLSRDDKLLSVKEESEDPLGERNYPALYTPNPAGISSDNSDPLANDDLSDPVTYKCSSVEEDQSSNDEGRYVVNGYTDGATSKLIYQDSPDQATSGEDGDKSWTMAQECTVEAFGLPVPEEIHIQTTPTSYLLAEGNVWNHSIDECSGPTALVTQTDSRTGTSHEGFGINLMDKDLDKCGALDADKKTCCSIPDDGQFNTTCIESLNGSKGRAVMTVVGDARVCDTPNTTDNLRFIKISGNNRSGCETVMGDNEEILNCSIKNPENSYRSNENSYQCFYCRDGFDDKNEVIKHMKIHSVPRSFDVLAESSIGDTSHRTLMSNENSSYCEPTTSKVLSGLQSKRLEPRQKGHVLIKETSGGKVDRRCIRQVTRGFTVEEKSSSQSLSSESSGIGNQGNRGSARRKGRPYSCTMCTKSFTQNCHLVEHIRSHTGEKPYSCNQCEKSFSNNSHLVSHIRTHTGERPYSCTECEKSFSSKSNLVSHVRTHSGEKPYSCGICKKSFVQPSCFNRHILTHTGEKPCVCDVCGKTFSRRDSLVSHVRTHEGKKPYSCGVCCKSFTVRSYLRTHMRSHTGERPYVCNLCGNSFTRRDYLVSHVRSHRGEKPYACDQCEKCFTRKDSLVAHLRKHSGDKP